MLEWFAETTIVAAILAVVAVLACRLRPSSPSIRHALWMVVLIKLITPPLISWPWAAPSGSYLARYLARSHHCIRAT